MTRSIHRAAEADLADAFGFYRREAGDHEDAAGIRILVLRHQYRDPAFGDARR